MALLFCDSFEDLSWLTTYGKWDTYSRCYSITGRTGNGLQLGTGGLAGYCYRALGGNYSTMIVGAAISLSAANTGIALYDGSTQQVSFRFNYTDLSIALYRGSTVLATSSPGVFPSSGWAFVEFKATIDNTTGSLEARVNGVSVVSVSGVDTQSSANAYANTIRLGGTAGAASSLGYFDDFYLCDTSGSYNNDFLGDVIVETSMPNAVGSNNDWTALGGSSHYLEVDEASVDGDTSYVYTATASARDTYGLMDISASGGTVMAVAVNVVAEKDGADTRGIKPVVKSSTSYAQGAETILSLGSYLSIQSIFETDPSTTSAWTESAVNAMEAGVDLTT